MHEPDYTDYSLNQLHDCLEHINPDKYPLRFAQLQQEMELRSESGESRNDPVFNELAAVDVPIPLGFWALYAFSWRFAVAAGIYALLIFGVTLLNDVLHLFSPAVLLALEIFSAVLFFSISGTIIMMQVLSKRYRDYRIRIIRLHKNNPPLHKRSAQ